MPNWSRTVKNCFIKSLSTKLVSIFEKNESNIYIADYLKSISYTAIYFPVRSIDIRLDLDLNTFKQSMVFQNEIWRF